MKLEVFAVIGCLVFGVLRFIVPVEGSINHADIFKDLAHIWIGMLIGWAILRKGKFTWLAIGLTILEVVAFIVRKS